MKDTSSSTSSPRTAVILVAALVALVAIGALALVAQPQAGQPAPAVVELPLDAPHDAMMLQMRAGVTPAMAQRMQDAQAWPMVRDPVHIQRLEQRQAGIDRMLGRDPAGPRR